ncbi:MAG: MarR family transcriptional regulator [Deltaproteobacteria bacterium]|nr:MarR family transcriptional regulator [Deltaproteobacteria bacterium]
MTDFEALKRRSLLQVLFKAARLANEEAIGRVREALGDDRIRVTHTNLFPHIPFEGIRLTALAARLGISKQAVQQLVDELDALGVLERRPDPADGRARLICWTERGRAGLVHGIGILDGLAAEVAADVDADDLAATHRVLLAMVDRWE